jgi:hypothetical protein
VIVVSQTPTEALVREWTEHGIDQQVRFIAGQELGTKTEHIRFAAGGKYAPGKMLMIGDAPGDYKAARGNGALFYPINPGDEEASWKRLHDEALERFFAGSYAGDYEAGLIREFDAHLPEKPAWGWRGGYEAAVSPYNIGLAELAPPQNTSVNRRSFSRDGGETTRKPTSLQRLSMP